MVICSGCYDFTKDFTGTIKGTLCSKCLNAEFNKAHQEKAFSLGRALTDTETEAQIKKTSQDLMITGFNDIMEV